MSVAIGLVQCAGLVARDALDRGASRADSLAHAGHYLFSAYGGSEAGKTLGILAPAFALAWCEAGFPSVTVGHRLAASMMCTAYPEVLCREVNAPWRCFGVTIPSGVMGPETTLLVLFARGGGVRALNFYGDRVEAAIEPDLAGWADAEPDTAGMGWDDRPFPAEWGARERVAREMRLVGRVLAGTCVELDTPKMHETARVGPPHPSRRNKRGQPAAWSFQLSRDVAVDLRPYVRAFVSGERGGSLNVQHLVRGHWRRTVAGAGGAERRWSHIEPYWRGDVNAPLPLRTHTLE